MTVVENVQRRATKYVPGLKDLEYEDRLRSLRLPSLTYRRSRGDMIEVYKHLKGHYTHDFSYLKRTGVSVRGHSLRLSKECAQHQSRRKFFSYRVVDQWNSLPEDVVSSPTLNNFKNNLDSHWERFHYQLSPPTMRTHPSERSQTVQTVSQDLVL